MRRKTKRERENEGEWGGVGGENIVMCLNFYYWF